MGFLTAAPEEPHIIDHQRLLEDKQQFILPCAGEGFGNRVGARFARWIPMLG
jgi:hypothetical protein